MQPTSTISILDAEANRPFQEIDLTDVFGPDAGGSIRTFTLHGGSQEGIQVVEIHNGELQISVLPTRGMGIWKGKCGDIPLGWDSPVKDPVHPMRVDLLAQNGLGWLQGFNEWIVRCGLSNVGAPGEDTLVDNNGNPAKALLPLHGRIANLSARKVSIECTTKEIMLRGEIDEVSMFGPALRLSTVLRMARHSPAVTLQDTVTNLSGTEAEHQLLYHINFGEPLLEEGARFVAPVQRLAPRDQRASLGIRTFDRFTGPEEHFIEQVYYLELTGRPATRETMVMLHNANADRGTALRYRLEDLPCFSLWKNTAAKANGYVTGLEPATAFPNCRRVERKHGRVIRLQPGESRTTTLTLEVLRSRQAVQGAAREIEDIQGELQPLIHPDPIADFS